MKIERRGGKREGSGRKPLSATERKTSVTIQIKDETLSCLNNLCEKESKSRSVIITNLIMKNTILLLLLLVVCSCSTSDEIAPEPITPKKTTFEIGGINFAVVLKSTDMRFTITQEEHSEDFEVAATITPATAKVTINGDEISENMQISPDVENTLNFQPNEVGDHKLIFTITDKQGFKTIEEVKLRSLNEVMKVDIAYISDTVALKSSSALKLFVKQVNHPEDFILNFSVTPATTATVTLNGEEVSQNMRISPNELHEFIFTPDEIGDYKLQVELRDKHNGQVMYKSRVNVKAPKIIFEVGAVPESIAVESAAQFTFFVDEKYHTEDFKIKIDTTVPNYELYSVKHFGSADILLNGEAISAITSIPSNSENTISFANANVVGEYTITIQITDKYNAITSKEVVIRAFSPPIEIKWFTQDILGYMWESDKPYIYDNLNRDFSIDPLTKSLEGKQIDRLFTQECYPVGIDDGSTTFPGATVLLHIAQEGGNEMQYLQQYNNGYFPEDRKKNTTTWHNEFDIVAYWGREPIQQGFHGIRFETSTLTTLGTMYYAIRVVDKWGKEKVATLPYKCFGMYEKIPDWCITSDEIPFWWYTQAK